MWKAYLRLKGEDAGKFVEDFLRKNRFKYEKYSVRVDSETKVLLYRTRLGSIIIQYLHGGNCYVEIPLMLKPLIRLLEDKKIEEVQKTVSEKYYFKVAELQKNIWNLETLSYSFIASTVFVMILVLALSAFLKEYPIILFFLLVIPFIPLARLPSYSPPPVYAIVQYSRLRREFREVEELEQMVSKKVEKPIFPKKVAYILVLSIVVWALSITYALLSSL